MSAKKSPRYSPMQGFFKQALLRIGLPIAVVVLCLYAAWLGGTRRQRYVQQVADEWHDIRVKAFKRGASSVEDMDARARGRARHKAP